MDIKKVLSQALSVLDDFPEIALASLYGSCLHGRMLKKLKDEKRIEFQGPHKTGGYYLR